MTHKIRALACDPASGTGSSIGLSEVVLDVASGVEEFRWGQEISFDANLSIVQRFVRLHEFLCGQSFGGTFDVVVIENQHKWGAGTKKSIIPLAQSAGVCLVSLARLSEQVLFPEPSKVSTLKGKDTKHDQMLIKLGIKRQDVIDLTEHVRIGRGRVEIKNKPSKAGILDVMDSITLARWGIKQEVARLRRAKFEKPANGVH